MKIKKTPMDKRTTYTYRGADGNVVTLCPGKDGITKAGIKRLRA